MGKSTRPAEGERAAVGGYHAQYLLAADLILQRLDEGRLEWVRVADPEAGRLDDFQLATPNRVDAYQFKWGAHPEGFTYTDLTREKKTEDGKSKQPPLITQLVDGWRTLRQNHSGRRVVVHLTTNDYPSNAAAATLPVGPTPPARKTFAAFIAECWALAKTGACPPDWQTTLNSLLAVPGLPTADHPEFLQNCEFEFGKALPSPSSNTRAGLYRWQNLQALVAYLLRTVAGRTAVELTADRLLRDLGWLARYAYRSRHEFPDPGGPYLPIASTLNEFEDRLTRLRGGYIAVLGPPGSGKSTLLTRALRQAREERVVRYYAYVPEAQDPAVSRGEAVNFLHDVCLALQHSGVSTEGTHLPVERELLLERFHRQLHLLGEEFINSGRKTLILVDGLDHIDRELRPTRSLLADLPRPDQIPDGVFIILGSQTDQLQDLPEVVRQRLDQNGRRIQIGRLSREAVRDLIRGSNLPVELSSSQLEAAFAASDGHPLALSYSIEALRSAANSEVVDAALAAVEPYRGDIEAQYRAFFRNVEGDEELLRLLSAVARLRGAADLNLMARWFGQGPVRRLVSAFRRYFVVEADDRWRFFHNSFRLFLVKATAKRWDGSFDPDLDRAAHRALADSFGAESPDTPANWEELYHRVSAADHEGVCSLSRQEYFRRQIFALRPLGAVNTDIDLALPSAAAREDLRAYAALTLMSAEVTQRHELLGEFDLPRFLLATGQVARAADAVRDGNRLRVGATNAMKFAVQLELRGEGGEARRVFELAEPLEELAGNREGSNSGQIWKVLQTWASSAPYFLNSDNIIARIHSTPASRPNQELDDENEPAARLHCYMLAKAGLTYLELGRWQEFEQTLAALPHAHEENEARFELLLAAAEKCSDDGNRCAHFLDRLQSEVQVGTLTTTDRIRLAEALLDLRADVETARTLAEGIPLPLPEWKRVKYTDDAFGSFLPLLRHARLLFRLGGNHEVRELVTDDADHEDSGVVWFLRDIVVVARIWAQARTGHARSGWDIKQDVSGIMQRFHRPHDRGKDWHTWSVCLRARGPFYRSLIWATSEHGRDALRALRDTFDLQWTGDSVQYWPVSLQREIATEFAMQDDSHTDWAASHLHRIEAVGFGEELYEQVTEGQAQLKAWLAIGAEADAARVLDVTLRGANGVHGEDHQISHWLRWLDRVASENSDARTVELDWFARAVVVLGRSADGGASTAAAERLVVTAGRLDAGKALRLARWFLERRVFDHADSVKAFLRAVLPNPELPARLTVYALADLVVPFDSQADPGLTESVVIAAHRRLGTDAARWALDYVERRVAIYALARTRRGWRSGMRSAATKLGIASLSAEPEENFDEVSADTGMDPRQPPSVLVLGDGEQVNLEQVLSRSQDLPAVIDYASREHYSSNFDWRPVLDRLIALHPLDMLSPVARQLRAKRQVCQHLVALSDQERPSSATRAWQLASLAVDATDRYMWSARFGEGTRFLATGALILADPVRGRARLWELLVREKPRDPTILEDAARQLRDVFPLDTVWPEVRDHLHAMFDPQLTAGDSVPPPLLDEAIAPVEGALATLLLMDVDHPVASLTRAARRACAEALMSNEPAVLDGVRERLVQRGDNLRALLEVLDASSAHFAQLLTGLRADLEQLADVPDAAVVVLADDLVRRAGGESLRPPTRALPDQYSVLVPEQATRRFRAPGYPEPGQPWPDTDDPRQLLGIVQEVYGILAERTGWRAVDLLHRGARLMYELVPVERWSADGERELYRRLEGARLQFTFRRPRADVAFRATFRLTAELWQAGEIGEDEARFVVEHLRQCDPALALREPLLRPTEVPEVIFDGRTDYDVEKWVDKGNASLSLLANRLADGRWVVAESSDFKILGNGTLTEERYSTLRPATKHDSGELFPPISRRLVRRYANPVTEVENGVLVVCHEGGSSFENPAGSWIAFNPAVADSLGWLHAQEGLFRWTDNTAQTMVESLWWLDGPVGLRAHLADEKVAEGWLVVATDAAIDALKSAFKDLRRVRRVNRSGPDENRTEHRREFRDSVPFLRRE